MFGNKHIGKLGEDIASKHILNNGYILLERNFRSKHGEIDIIAKDGKFLVFIEVKTRKGNKVWLPKRSGKLVQTKQNKKYCGIIPIKKETLEQQHKV